MLMNLTSKLSRKQHNHFSLFVATDDSIEADFGATEFHESLVGAIPQ